MAFTFARFFCLFNNTVSWLKYEDLCCAKNKFQKKCLAVQNLRALTAVPLTTDCINEDAWKNAENKYKTCNVSLNTFNL